MNIVNLVGKLSFDTDLKGAEKFLAISKKCNEEAKALKKNLKKVGEDEMFVGLGERAKRLKEELKSIKTKGYSSPKTIEAMEMVKALKAQRSFLNNTYRDLRIKQDQEIFDLKNKGDIFGYIKRRKDRAQDYIKYRRYRSEIDKTLEYQTENLNLYKAQDKATLEEMLSRKQAGTDVLEKARDERKKQILDENKLTKEKIENLKEESARNKERAKNEQKAHKNNLFTLGRFALAVGSAVTVLKGIESVYRNTINATSNYMNATAGSDIAPEKLEGMATNLAGLGVDMSKKDLAPILGKLNWRAGTRRFGQNMNAQNLAMANVDPSQALTAESTISNLYRSYLNGTSEELIANALSSEGVPAGVFMSAFKMNKRKGTSAEDFYKTLTASRMGADKEAKGNILQGAGWLNKQWSRFTGATGMMWNDLLSKGQTPLESMARYYERQQSQGGNINYNKNITVNTNNAEAVKEAINDEMTSFKILPLTNGGTN